MRLFIDKENRAFVTSATFNSRVSSVDFKRGDSYNLEIGFVEDNALVQLSGNPVIQFGIKEQGDYDGDLLVYEDTWTWDSGNSVYQGSPDFNTTGLNGLLGHDESGNATEDVASVTTMLEITYHTGDSNWASSNTISAVVHHDVIGGSEGVPTTGTPAYPAASDVMTLSTAQTAAGDKTFNGDTSFAGEVEFDGTTFVDASSGKANLGEFLNTELMDLSTTQSINGTKTFYGDVNAYLGLTSYGPLVTAGTPPLSGTADGTQGQIARGTDGGLPYLYVCTGANAWGRVQLQSW